MNAYTSFAEVYDEFMDNVPYDKISAYIQKILKKDGIREGLVLDLGCGTGVLTGKLSDAGYDMIGVDASADMLDLAMNKGQEGVLYLQQDMRSFELYGTVRAVVSTCDCINYITKPSELLHVFRLVNNYLDPKGLFIFDFHPVSYYARTLKNRTFGEDRDDIAFLWENTYHPATRMNLYDLSIFIKEGDLYHKYKETHLQRGYTLGEIKKLLSMAGMTYLGAYDDCSTKHADARSKRIFVIAREQGK